MILALISSSSVDTDQPTTSTAPTDKVDILFSIGGVSVTPYAIVVLLITVLLIVTSLLTMVAILSSSTLKDVIGHYLLSLAITDFLTGTLIAPLAFYAALIEDWRFGDNKALWKIQAYLEITLWSTTVFTFMWIAVDRYAALKKPARYEIEQTFTRCKCWIIFTWVTSALLSCPTLFGEMQARYYEQAYVSILDWSSMAPYSATLGVLVMVPSLVSVVYSYSFILRKLHNPEDLEDNQKTLLDNDPSYMMTLFVIVTFIISWLPWFALKTYETFFRDDLNSKPLHFSLFWLGIGSGNWKVIIYTAMNPEFRKSMSSFCHTITCGVCRNTDPDLPRSSAGYTAIASSSKRDRAF